MKPGAGLYWVVTLIAGITIVSGLAQMVAPGMILRFISGETTPTSLHFFGIIGMFMALFGGALMHALLSVSRQPIVVLWAGLQKFGAVAAVGLGVLKSIFSPLALFVAGFDLLSALLVICYWLGIRESS
jgi:hypothetical protein